MFTFYHVDVCKKINFKLKTIKPELLIEKSKFIEFIICLFIFLMFMFILFLKRITYFIFLHLNLNVLISYLK